MHGGRTMKQYSEAFIGFDTAKKKHAVADVGRESETRYLGEIDSSPAAVERMIRKLAGRYEKLHFCYEAGPTGYGLYRQVRALGHHCTVVAPSLIPNKSGERVKTNRRDAVTLARLLRAGELNVGLGAWHGARSGTRSRPGARGRIAGSAPQTAAAVVLSAPARADLRRPPALEPCPFALAGAAEIRSPGSADCLPGCGGHDR
jgi:hypothetical protein